MPQVSTRRKRPYVKLAQPQTAVAETEKPGSWVMVKGELVQKVAKKTASMTPSKTVPFPKRTKSGRPLGLKPSRPMWRGWTFVEHFDADPMVRIDMVKQGLPAKVPGEIAARMGITKDKMYNILGLPRATVERKVREDRALSPDESGRVLGVSRLVGQAQRMVEESGNPDGFDAGAWVASWIERPVPALGGRKPAELMDTAEGQALVATVLSRAQSGAYG